MKIYSAILACTIFLLGISPVDTSAQVTKGRILPRVGIKAGLNYSNIFSDGVDRNSLAGFNAGLFAKVPVTGSVSIQPELYFTTKGSRLTYNSTFANGDAQFKLSYLELPVLFVYNLSRHFNIQAGPYVSYLLDGKATNKSSAPIFDFENQLKNDDYNRLDAGLAAGLALDVSKISFGARYTYGMTTIGKENTYAGTNYRFPDGKNSVFNFYVALSFN